MLTIWLKIYSQTFFVSFQLHKFAENWRQFSANLSKLRMKDCCKFYSQIIYIAVRVTAVNRVRFWYRRSDTVEV